MLSMIESSQYMGLALVQSRNRQLWARVRQNWTMEQWKTVAWSDGSHFLFQPVDSWVHMNGVIVEDMQQDELLEEGEPLRQCDALEVVCWET